MVQIMMDIIQYPSEYIQLPSHEFGCTEFTMSVGYVLWLS